MVACRRSEATALRSQVTRRNSGQPFVSLRKEHGQLRVRPGAAPARHRSDYFFGALAQCSVLYKAL